MNILLATDGSDCAHRALEYLRNFPFPTDSRIHLLTVLDQEAFQASGEAEMSAEQKRRLDQAKNETREQGLAFLREQAQSLSAQGYQLDTLVRTGHPAEEIILAASELDSDLIVVGSHGLSGVKRCLLGSVSNRVLQHAGCSVLIVQQPTSETTRSSGRALSVLLAYDGSPSSKRAVEFLANLPLGNRAEVLALSVLPVIRMFRQDVNQRLTWLWQEQKLQAEQALSRITHEVRWGHPAVKTELLESENVGQAILETAKRDQSDLIVLGHKGKGAIDRFLLGSVTADVAHHARCSVLAVRSKA